MEKLEKCSSLAFFKKFDQNMGVKHKKKRRVHHSNSEESWTNPLSLVYLSVNKSLLAFHNKQNAQHQLYLQQSGGEVRECKLEREKGSKQLNRAIDGGSSSRIYRERRRSLNLEEGTK